MLNVEFDESWLNVSKEQPPLLLTLSFSSHFLIYALLWLFCFLPIPFNQPSLTHPIEKSFLAIRDFLRVAVKCTRSLRCLFSFTYFDFDESQISNMWKIIFQLNEYKHINLVEVFNAGNFCSE